MKRYRETRKLSAHELRALCIRKNWYTKGDNDEYQHLLLDLAENKENLETADIIAIAEDIVNHSELEPGYDLESVAFEVVRQANTFFEAIDSVFNVMMKSEGGTKHLLTSFDNGKDAESFCEQLNWEWVDPETSFVWGLDIEEKEV